MCTFLIAAVALTISPFCGALLDERFISFEGAPSALKISGSTILVDSRDFPGVRIAAASLAGDLQRVTPSLTNVSIIDVDSVYGGDRPNAVIVGTIGSRIIQQIAASSTFNISSIEGKWESFITSVVDAPIPGIERALVIAGSDKRGAIYGIYTLSEQIGVSPWYWWADVEVPPHPGVYALPITTAHGEPSVKYRGIFINDEAPSLTSWVLEKFGPKYNVEFYKHVFELLLRLRMNFLWPAMWPAYPEPGNSFFVDDPLNQKTADEYGIVVSTMHHEPMQRATNEWLTSGNGAWE